MMPNNKLYDREKVLIGLAIFVAVISFPFWFNMGKAAPAPELKLSNKAKAAKQCIAPTPYMRAEHMAILDLWRDTVVRDAKRVYSDNNGRQFNMSLSTGEDSCMGCHVTKADFCDKCHNYASVRPYCWDCHIAPKENK
ncbi:MAG: HmeE1 [Candidatus Magnetoglobus multicellularis str. Araruama]|uniref:HmeE1 n=1 Tax=Candidatus Magnetoglobus multicellularis str. Araruama TaxID=890399 RepID=A0A1V1P745_9BACT|nr:MAG: HmeE1 [Candidatus Magnetoglobus multicellularis str. Araruama]